MKIALVTAQLSTGGAEKMVYQLACGLRQRGETVTVIAGEGTYAKQLKAEGIEVIHLPLNQKTRWWRSMVWKRLHQILKREDFDVVHVHTVPLAFLLRGIQRIAQLRAKTVLTFHGSSMWKLHIVSPLIKGLRLVRCAVSPDLAKAMEANHIPNAVRPSNGEFQKDEEGNGGVFDLGCRQVHDPLRVGIVARLVREKGIDIWFEATQVLNRQGIGIHTFLVGDGPERERLMVQNEDNGCQSDFLGWQSEPWKALQQIDLIVQPSRREGEPLALLEAMAMGFPIVATKVGGVPSLLAADAGILVDPDVRGLCKGVSTFLAMPEAERSRMCGVARERVKERTWDRCVDAYLAIYRGG